MSISPFSKKRLERIASGKEKIGKGTFKIDVKKLMDKRDAMSKEVRDALFGKAPKAPRPKVKEQITYPMAEKMCDAAFSQWKRLVSADGKGIVKCFICGREMYWTSSVLMHFQSRTCIAIQWDEIANQAGCRTCNGKPNGDRTAFAERLDQEFGPGTSEALTIKSKRQEKPTTDDLLVKARFYRERIAWIKEHDPEKFIKPA